MKKIHLLILTPLLLLLVIAYTKPIPFYAAEAYKIPVTKSSEPAAASVKLADTQPAGKILSYAKTLLGTPYFYTGISPETGFDCSGFITHVFGNEGIDVPHSSAMQANEGLEVDRTEAKAGDIIIFTGTNLNVRKPGHAGIVLSAPGDTITFIHSSSNGGVKISKVEGTRYNERFLEVRRIL